MFDVGTKVRCISNQNTPWPGNRGYLVVDSIYTVSGNFTVTNHITAGPFESIMLEEIDAILKDRPYFHESDFDFLQGTLVLQPQRGSTPTANPDDSWDRAFKGM